MERISLLQRHLTTWNGCTRCELHEHRSKMIFCKGSIPCDIIFIGEAPGKSEDSTGIPFAGPAGHLLDGIIKNSIPSTYRLAFTNLVCCIPLDEEGTDKLNEPKPAHIKSCQPRLIEFVRIAKPRMIVLVGKLAKKHISGQAMFADRDDLGELPWLNRDDGEFLQFVEIVHPAAILRQPNEAMKSFAKQKCVVTLKSAIATLEQ